MPAALGIDAAALDAALAALRHQPRGDKLRDVMGEGRFGDVQGALNLADGQSRFAGANEQMKDLQAVGMAKLGEAARCVVERQWGNFSGRAHPQGWSSGW